MEFIELFFNYFPKISVIAGMVTAATPTPKDDNFLKKTLSVCDVLAFNWLHARNKN